MDRTELRDLKTSFAREHMSRGSGIYGVTASVKEGEPVLVVTVAEGRRSPVAEFHGVKIRVQSGSPGAVAVGPRFA